MGGGSGVGGGDGDRGGAETEAADIYDRLGGGGGGGGSANGGGGDGVSSDVRLTTNPHDTDKVCPNCAERRMGS